MFDLAAVPAADRPGALQAQLVAWEPLPQARYLVIWQAAAAQVYAVDRQRIADATVKSPQWLPESLAREPGTDGVRLVQGLDGVEGQAWKGGVLHSSRWWSSLPSVADWQQFLRQAQWAAPPAEGLPPLQSPAWLMPASLPVFSDELSQARQGSEQRLAGALALVLLGMAAMSTRVLWDGFDARRQAQQGLVELREQVAPVLAARERALSTADLSTSLITQLRAPQPLEVLEELLGFLPKAAQIREFDLNGMDVQVTLDLPPDAARSKVIADLESGGWFTQLAETKDGQTRGGLSLQMKLSGPRPPQRSNADAGLQRMATDGAPPLQPADGQAAQTHGGQQNAGKPEVHP